MSNIVESLGDEIDFRVVCLDRDSKQTAPYPDIRCGSWTPQGKALVCYHSSGELSLTRWRAIAAEVGPDVVYLNSLVDRAFSIFPMLALGSAGYHVVLAPRGELADSALSVRAFRKRLFLHVARASRVYRSVRWHATSVVEIENIRRAFGLNSSQVCFARNLANPSIPGQEKLSTQKRAGELRIVFLSRITPIKNLLSAIRVVSRMTGAVSMDVYGPIADVSYWKTCEDVITRGSGRARIMWRGEVPNEQVPRTLMNYDVFFLPTLGENFGHAIAEALAAGLPVVISNLTPWQNLGAEGVGVDLPIGDEDAFVEALRAFQAMGEPEMASVRKRCRAYLEAWRQDGIVLEHYRELFRTGDGARVHS